MFLSLVFTSISCPLLCHCETMLRSAAGTLQDRQFQMKDSVHHITISLLPFHTELRGENKRTKFFIIPHELIKANINPSLTGGTNSCSGITCICSRHSWWQDWLCLPYFANISHWCLWFSVICFCAIALSLAAKQPYDMVAAFLLQNHCPLLPPQSRGLSQHDWAASRRMQAPPAQWSISAVLVLSFILDCTLEVLHK